MKTLEINTPAELIQEASSRLMPYFQNRGQAHAGGDNTCFTSDGAVFLTCGNLVTRFDPIQKDDHAMMIAKALLLERNSWIKILSMEDGKTWEVKVPIADGEFASIVADFGTAICLAVLCFKGFLVKGELPALAEQPEEVAVLGEDGADQGGQTP